MEQLPQVGDIVRLMRYNGVVQHIYTREDGADAWLEIVFVNNLFKQQPYELQLWSKVKELLQFSDRPALDEELEATHRAVEQRFSQVMLAIDVNGKHVNPQPVAMTGESHEQLARAQ
jgi:hypothetical protein